MFLYIFYILISPLIWLLLLFLSFFNKKIQDHWNNLWITINNVKFNLKKTNKKIVLFHAASAGEFEQLIPILKSLDSKKYYIIQSFFSPTIYNEKTHLNFIDSI